MTSWSKAGAEVRIYSTGTDPIQAVEGDTSPTQKVDVDGTFGDLDVSSVDAVVVPGGTVNADHIRIDEDAQSIVREALDTDKVRRRDLPRPVAPGERPGSPRDATLTSYPSLALDLENAGATWKDEEVVVDGTLITSRNPDDLPAFVEAISEALVG